jgi:spermidine/putrescine transport system ATP-binding protein
MQIELQNLQRSVGITFVLVTHDQEEALSMSDRVTIMRDGRIVQTGSPRELYDEPASRYVADFVGKSNFFDGVVLRVTGPDKAEIRLDGFDLPARTSRSAGSISAGEKVSLSVRPEQMAMARGALPAETVFRSQGEIVNRIFLGEHTEYLVREARLGPLLVLQPRWAETGERPFEPGETVNIGWRQGAAIALPSG